MNDNSFAARAEVVPIGINPHREALQLMVEALRLLDENDGPHDAGAHLDDAIHRLRKSIAESGGSAA
jgi:hypothetical protein